MHDKHPDVMVRLEEDNPDNLTKSLLNGSIDCALNYLDPSRAGASELNCAHVHDCSYLVVMRKDLMEELADEVDLRDVQLPLMTLTKVQGNRLSYQTGAGTGDLSFTVHASSNTHRSLLLQAQCGQCAVLIPQDSWEPTAGLEARRISNCRAIFSTYLFWRKDNTNVAIKLFRQDVERYFDSLG